MYNITIHTKSPRKENTCSCCYGAMKAPLRRQRSEEVKQRGVQTHPIFLLDTSRAPVSIHVSAFLYTSIGIQQREVEGKQAGPSRGEYDT